MTKRSLNWGLLSTARINAALINPLMSSPRNHLLAVASRDQERALAYAAARHIPRAYGTYEALLADPEIDVVYISLPNSLHREWTIKACEAGKHVLCEKPLALTTADVDAIADAARRAGTVVAEAFMYRHHPQTLKVKDLIDGGAIGRLRIVRGAFTFQIRRERDVRLDPALGGGSIWDVGCYPIGFARTVAAAAPVEVFGWQEVGPSGVDLVFAGQMRFADGVLAQFDCGFQGPVRMLMEFVGTEGSISLDNAFKPGPDDRIELRHGDDGRRESIAVQAQELYLGEVEDLADAILTGRGPRISLDDSRANVATILALLSSANEGRPISL